MNQVVLAEAIYLIQAGGSDGIVLAEARASVRGNTVIPISQHVYLAEVHYFCHAQ